MAGGVAGKVEFFGEVEATAPKKEPAPQYGSLLIGGSIGIVVWLGFISMVFMNRKRKSVKHDIFKRQKRGM